MWGTLLSAAPAALSWLTSGGNIDSAKNYLFTDLSAVDMWNTQQRLARRPLVPAGVGELMSAELRGFMGYGPKGKYDQKLVASYVQMMRRHGIYIDKNPVSDADKIDYQRYQDTWNAVRNSMIERPGIDAAFKGRIAGILTEDKFDQMLFNQGARSADWTWLFPLICERLSIYEVLELWKRGTVTDKELEQYAAIKQYGVNSDIDKMKELAFEVPGAADIVRFVIRDAFNPELITALQLDKELDQNPMYLAVAKAAGLGPVKIKDDKGEMKEVDFAKMYWYAHWVQPAPGQVFEFLHRYYKGSRYGDSPWLPMASEFNQEDAERLLRAQDYSPAFRKHLVGLSFSPYTRIDVRRLYRDDIITKEEVYHNYRASGYADKEANNLTDWVEKDLKNSRFKEHKSRYKALACESYDQGRLDANEYETVLTDAGFTKEDAKAELAVCDMASTNKFMKDAIASAKAGYLSGAYSDKELQMIFGVLEINAATQQSMLYLWKLKLNSRRKIVAAGEVSGWFLDGMISLEELISRLTKLQYSPPDVTRIVQSVLLRQAKNLRKAEIHAMEAAQKQMEKNVKDAEKRRKEIEALQREKQRELDAIKRKEQSAENKRLAEFLSARTDKNLIQWWKEGFITEQEVRDTLKLRGWIAVDIERWIRSHKPRG